MLIKIGYDISLNLSVPSAVLCALFVHPDREKDLLAPEDFHVTPDLPVEYLPRHVRQQVRARRSPMPARSASPPAPPSATAACPTPTSPTPSSTRSRTCPSRCCPTCCPAATATATAICSTSPGTASAPRPRAGSACRPSSISCTSTCASITRRRAPTAPPPTASRKASGVCRDFTHLAITLCRCMNIPARYATGYLGDIGVPPVPDPMDFSAWFEVYLESPLVHLRRAAQPPAHRPHRHGPRPRRQRRGAHHRLRLAPAHQLHRRDGRSDAVTAFLLRPAPHRGWNRWRPLARLTPRPGARKVGHDLAPAAHPLPCR